MIANIKINLPLLSILIFHALFGGAQSLPCGGDRFIKKVFPTTTVTPGILFGRNTTYAGVTKDLYMDIFEPIGDSAEIRPLFILAFGGAFISGNRTQLGRLCDSLAGKGYVAATIDYRLYDNPSGPSGLLDPNHALDAVAKGMSDIKAAIRYFKRDAATTKTYRIDTASIFIGGISSGSISALHTAYINTLSEVSSQVDAVITANGGMEGNTDLPGTPLIGTYSFQGIRGVWNMSGALYDSGYIKTGDPALFGIHGTNDDIVPYGYNQLFFGFGPFVSGSSSLHNQAINVGVPTSFISVIGGDHEEMYADTAVVIKLDSTASNFFGNILCPTILPVTGISLKGNIVNKQVQLSWQTLTEIQGFVVEKLLPAGWASLGELYSKSNNSYSSLPLDYTFNDIQPERGYNIYRLKIISLDGEITYSNITRVLWNDRSADVFVIYPNPAGALLYYKTILPGTGKNILKIYSADMRLVQTNTLNSVRHVPVSGLTPGLYLAILYDSQNRQRASSWFVKE